MTGQPGISLVIPMKATKPAPYVRITLNVCFPRKMVLFISVCIAAG